MKIDQTAALAFEKFRYPILVRSSAYAEVLKGRDLYKSMAMPGGATFEMIIDEMKKIYRHLPSRTGPP